MLQRPLKPTLGVGVALALSLLAIGAPAADAACGGVKHVRARRRSGRLPPFVVIALGTNLNITLAEIRAALRILGRRRVLGLVTPREDGGGSGPDARVVRQAGRRHRGRVLVLDWVRFSAGRGGWFGGDGIHLGPGGAAGLGRLLNRGLRRVYILLARFELVGGRAF